ncbi:MAG TPA: L,D-transpeptidase family protein [Burkholderiales bacterium]|nr:L,D-transpeptidase family protein [Burkholderiales bacterium]
MARTAPRLILALTIVCASFAPRISQARSPDAELEHGLSSVIQAIEKDRPDVALQRVDALIAAHPTFRLAHLIRGDLLLARTRTLQTFGDVAKTVPRARVEGLREEALARLRALRTRPPAADRVPRDVLQLNPEQKYAIVVDSQLSRLYLFRNVGGHPQYVEDYYVTLGKRGMEKTREGDQKTPIGVYRVVASLPRNKLTDFYGAGAFPLDYPNAWDKLMGRDGHGIWLHGTPSDTYSRPPRASDGCIVLANPDLESVGRYVQIGLTPVIIADGIQWSSPAAVDADRKALARAIDAWRSDWESRNTARYLSHYSRRFRANGQDYAAWAAHKRKVNAAKSWIKVGISDLAMFRYPRERDFAVVSFDQNYRSNNLSNVIRKVQYWSKENGSWKILYEGAG